MKIDPLVLDFPQRNNVKIPPQKMSELEVIPVGRITRLSHNFV